MNAYQLHGPKDLRLTELDRPRPVAGEILLRVKRVGICGSDVHYYQHGRVGSFVPKRPFVQGHEFAGEVVATGDIESGLARGMRVAVDPSQPCGDCRFCQNGRQNLCENMRYFGSAASDPPLDGAFAEYIAVPARNCHPIPDSMSWGEAAMLEPLSVSLHALRRVGDLTGAAVLVAGGGAIGQLTSLVARALGASKVVLSDIDAFPRRFARQTGTDAVLDAADPEVVRKAFDLAPEGYDVFVEAAGASRALAFALTVVARGGTIVQVGTLPQEVSIPANLIMAKELKVLGSFRIAQEFPIALQLIASAKVDVKPLISKTFPFSKLLAAIEEASSKYEIIKIQVEI
jgi:L-idonate 5-dehydrogenase